MREDVRRLMSQVGWSDSHYREVAADEHQLAAAETWPLIAAVNRRLPRPADGRRDAEGGRGG